MLDELVRILAPPIHPLESGLPASWPCIEEGIGTALPSDYRSFVERYGSGGINEWLYVFNPFAASKYTSLQSQISIRLGALRQLREEYGVILPCSVYPEVNGVLPWACSGNGDVLYWLTRGEPAEWPIWVNESRGPDWEQYAESMTGFLVKLIKGELKVSIFPEDVFGGKPAHFTATA